jgi:hypothetical protein
MSTSSSEIRGRYGKQKTTTPVHDGEVGRIIPLVSRSEGGLHRALSARRKTGVSTTTEDGGLIPRRLRTKVASVGTFRVVDVVEGPTSNI